MSTYVKISYHIVFGTKYRIPCLAEHQRDLLFRYIWGVLKNKKCHLYRINGVDDHIHIFTHIHQTVPVSLLVKDIKLASHAWIKKENLFPGFKGWQEGYGAFTHHISDKDRLIRYIKCQKEHHKKVTWPDELKALLQEHGIPFHEKYLV